MKCNTITEAVTSGSNTDDAIQSMIRLVAESWRFTRGVLRMAEKLDVVSQDRLANQARFFIRQLDDILTCHETGRKIAEVFKQAKASAPAMVIIDEMEAFLPERNATPNVHSLEELAEFLRQLQDAGKQQVLVSAMTNRLDLIDAAVLRRGRFDHILEVGPAGKEEIVVLLEALLSKIPHVEVLVREPLLD